MDAGGAAVLAEDIQDKGALSELDVSGNKLAEGKQTGEFGQYEESVYETDMSGVIALSEVLKTYVISGDIRTAPDTSMTTGTMGHCPSLISAIMKFCLEA